MNYINDYPSNSRVRLGDICVVYISERIKYTLEIKPESELQTKFGILKAEDLINHPYGVRYECKKGWILPLRLTPELWTQLLLHRTQILYQTDISMILLQLDIKPGSIVVESGTGSGSLSHSILRACLPSGYLHTFDINETRANEARKEFQAHGFGQNVTVTARNICESGFGQELEGKADACILDLPQTWLAIEHANRVLKLDGSRLCTFSPCIEQVQMNVAKMEELKFKDIETLECLLRPYEVRVKKLRVWDEEVLQGLAAVDRFKLDSISSEFNQTKRARITEEDSYVPNSRSSLRSLDRTKVTPMEDDEFESLNRVMTDTKTSFNPCILPKKSYTYAKQYDESVSHSGFLTFASKRR